MRNRSAIVVGGGIGGLAAARALRLTGWEVTLFEQAPAFTAAGAGVGLAPNAMRAMAWLGLDEEVRSRGIAQGLGGIRSATGRWLLRLREEEIEERFGHPMVGLRRAALHQLLLDTLDPDTVHSGHRATGVAGGQDSARVTFQGPDGPVSATADLVVAADGVHSQLRPSVVPGYPGAAYAGYACWRGIIPAELAAPIALDHGWVESWGRGLRFGVARLGAGQVYWFACAALPEGERRDATLDEVAAWYRGWHAPVPQLLRVTPPDALIRNDVYYLRAPLRSFVRGRVALLGDAAHAVTPDIGQGACLAIEDAVVLAAGIPDGTEVVSGLRAYDRSRRPRTQMMAQMSGRIGRVAFARGRLTAGLRDLLASVAPPSWYLRAGATAYSWTPAGGDAGGSRGRPGR